MTLYKKWNQPNTVMSGYKVPHIEGSSSKRWELGNPSKCKIMCAKYSRITIWSFTRSPLFQVYYSSRSEQDVQGYDEDLPVEKNEEWWEGFWLKVFDLSSSEVQTPKTRRKVGATRHFDVEAGWYNMWFRSWAIKLEEEARCNWLVIDKTYQMCNFCTSTDDHVYGYDDTIV